MKFFLKKSLTFLAWYVLYTYILLKSYSDRQNLLEVAKTAISCSKSQKLLESRRAQLVQVS